MGRIDDIKLAVEETQNIMEMLSAYCDEIQRETDRLDEAGEPEESHIREDLNVEWDMLDWARDNTESAQTSLMRYLKYKGGRIDG